VFYAVSSFFLFLFRNSVGESESWVMMMIMMVMVVMMTMMMMMMVPMERE
jgi:uncharacterized membrane protein YeiB